MIAGTDLTGLINQVGPRNRKHLSTAGSAAKSSHLTMVRQGAAPTPTACLDSAASAAEIVAAAERGELSRLVVVSVDAEQHPGGVDLVRSFAALGSAAILIDLTPGYRIAALAGLAREQGGMAEVAAGTISFAQAIHRDRHSAAHVVPSGGYRIDAPGEGMSAHLPFTLSALKQTYDRCVIELDRASLDRLPALLDEQTAVVLAASVDDSADVDAIAAALERIGLEDVVVMQISPQPSS